MQRLEQSYLFTSNTLDSFFVELLARYLNLPERFKLQIVPAENALVNAGTDDC